MYRSDNQVFNNTLCAIFLLFFVCISSAYSQALSGVSPTLNIGGFTQITSAKSDNSKAFVFGFDRVRLHTKGTFNSYVDYKLMVDFIKTAKDTDKDGDTPAIIKDALVIFKPFKKVKLCIGKFKTPIGMEFNVPGKDLDFVKRGLVHSFVFERNMGMMVQTIGLGWKGLGFALGVFNYGPNKANEIGDPVTGNDYTFAGKMSYDIAKLFHLEISAGSASTSVKNQENVNLFDIGASYAPGKISFKGEYIKRKDRDNGKVDGSDFYIQSGFLINPHFEPIIKYESMNIAFDNMDRTDVTFGLNYFVNPGKHRETKVIFNYVSSSLESFDSIQLMFQFAY